ncbi:MAG: bifunctional alpha,alpha-trehalose-phosphate synthase (UDP-forming)/trehalose-phosphatase [Vicinamibacteria bacterium]|nr:bifunctional alpha,alpha-trehalose-phosphate synthase (UDP-forming)/trehalose-phosphatase [Vicinamibacteria bacterium]
MGRLIVVSNRLPMTLRRTRDGWRAERSTGGLATAMMPVMRRNNGLWVGWPGETPPAVDARRQELLDRWARRERLIAVDLAPEVARGFYEGFANQTLWPLFHFFPSHVTFDPVSWDSYVAANTRFMQVLLTRIEKDDLIWIHDYHLMLLPQLLRESLPDIRIGFFLHIPFPASEVFRVLPRREELLRGLLGTDCLAFQTHSHLQNLRSSLLRVLGLSSRMDCVQYGGRTIRLEALPIGIAPEEFSGLLDSDPETDRRLKELRQRFAGRRLLLAVDRVDFTKGIPERLRAYRRLLERSPDLRGKVVLVQVAVPSRSGVPVYENLRHEVNELIGALNGDFGTPDWTPVVYIRRAISRAELVALYAASDVGWVAPLRDGMNLVSKEYVACQRDGNGVLVLSEFAGAAAEMGEALLVNPYDEERTAATIEKALDQPIEERRERMGALRRRVLRNNAFTWADRFLTLLREAAAGRVTGPVERPQTLPIERAIESFHQARERWIFLDYDGTLVPFAGHPRTAWPTDALIRQIEELSRSERQHVALLSGRSREELSSWFGGVKGLCLVAEHGAALRTADGDWESLRPSGPIDWKERVRPVLEHFGDRTPGSVIEEKEFSLVWHYRMSDPEFGEWLANELGSTLEEMLAETELHAVRGKKYVEVKLAWANKAEAALRLAEKWPPAEFRLAMGDDGSDEELFDHLGEDAWTVRIGVEPSRARYRLLSPEDALSFIQRLIHMQAVLPVT